MIKERFQFFSGAEIPESFFEFLSQVKDVCIDLEADGLHHYYAKICLIQLNAAGENFIIDPLSNENVSELFMALHGKLIILHSGAYDIKLMKNDFDFIPDKVFDTMIAMQFLGYEKFGLADLVHKHFNITLAKGPQKMDWSKRPLPDKMFDYSVNDVKYLPELYEILRGELDKIGRLEWFEEQCRRLIDTSANDFKSQDNDSWRIKGSYALERLELAYLRHLWHWREEEAKLKNIPVFKILKNEDLIRLSKWCASADRPVSESPVAEHILPGKRRFEKCELARQAARRIPSHLLPSRKHPSAVKPVKCDDRIAAEVKEARDRIALKLNLNPTLIANQKTLSKIASETISDLEDLVAKCGMMHWQKNLLAEDIRKIFHLK